MARMTLRAILAALLLGFGIPAGAQTYKCKDAAGRITYSSQDCAAIGLIPAGEVQEKINVAPAFKPPPAPKPLPPTQAAKPAPKPAPAPMAAEPEKKKEPQRRCFVVQTPKGPVTRCNEVPEEDDKK